MSNTLYILKGARTTAVGFATRVFRAVTRRFALAPSAIANPRVRRTAPALGARRAQIRARRALVRVSTRPFATVLAFPVPASLIVRGVAGERASLTLKP